MAFIDVKLADIELEKPEALPAGNYVFTLLPGALYRTNKFTNAEELNVSFAVADGDYTGRRIFQSYPDPTSISKKSGKPNTWSAQALKVLEIALGEESLPGEDPATWLNRVATSGNTRFAATMAQGKYIPTGQTEARVEFNIFSPEPAA